LHAGGFEPSAPVDDHEIACGGEAWSELRRAQDDRVIGRQCQPRVSSLDGACRRATREEVIFGRKGGMRSSRGVLPGGTVSAWNVDKATHASAKRCN
jgi:hypothetical protein